MEAKELMINDLVKVTKGNLIGRVCDINQSRDFVGYCNIDAEETYLEASYMKYIEPIPLTEEILKKNGLFLEEDRPCKKYRLWLGDSYEEGFILVVFHNFDNGKEIALHIEAIPPYTLCNLMVVIKYVHELQHALRLCGLTELADNFKVE